MHTCFLSVAVYDMLYISPESGVENTLGAFIQMVDQALRHQVSVWLGVGVYLSV